MSKMGSHNPFGHLKHKLGPEKGSGVKLVISLPTTKSQESPISIEGLHAKLWAPKVVGVPYVGISRLPLGSLGTK
jgi:hypothetical protein